LQQADEQSERKIMINDSRETSENCRSEFCDWNGKPIPLARSKGGVKAVAHPFDNLIRTGIAAWPPPEIIQKLYKSRQSRAFEGKDLEIATLGLGYYCDPQSLHSEDAITWSVFGTIAHAPQNILETWLKDLFRLIDLPDSESDNAEIFLWRRLPHPDTLVSGGPEIDVGITTSITVILGEAKWLSGIGGAQGKAKDKDQIQLRSEFLAKYGEGIFPARPHKVVLGISLVPNAFKDTTPKGVIFRTTSWQHLSALPSHPLVDELTRYVEWKMVNSKMTGQSDQLAPADPD
jgi:hypothetical protein